MAAPLDSLVNPPFATNPPIRISVDAKYIGLAVAILALPFALANSYNLVVLLSALNSGIQSINVGIWLLFFVDIVLTLVAAVMALIGGWRMLRRDPAGKRLAIYGVGLAFLVEALIGLGFGTGLSSIVRLVILAMLYYAVVVSRFAGEGLAANR